MAEPQEIDAPLEGTVRPLRAVHDTEIAAGLLGPGLAIDPGAVAQAVVIAPIAGTLTELRPDGFVIETVRGEGVLVQLGADAADAEGFELLASEGDKVDDGQEILRWSPAAVLRIGRSPLCPVIVLDAKPDLVEAVALVDAPVDAGETLLIVH